MNIEGVVLAAGYSSRAGTFKLELELNGKTVIEHCIGSLIEFCSRIIVVGGYQIEKVQALLAKYPQVEVVLNSKFDEGMFTSVKEGMRHIQGDRFFFTPGDYPLISRDVCRSLLAVEGEIVIPVYRGRKGHPVLMSGSIAKELLKEDDTSNLRDYIRCKGFKPLEVEYEGILIDLDTRDDYKHILEKLKEDGVNGR